MMICHYRRSTLALVMTAAAALMIFTTPGKTAEDMEGDVSGEYRGMTGVKYLFGTFVAVTATQKIKLKFNGTDRLLEITDDTTIRDGDKNEPLVLKDLGKYVGRRPLVYFKDGKAIHINFSRAADGKE